jgi:shikimate dehydrogenase
MIMDMQQRILVGLIGANILKSLSPAMFEHACAAAGIQGHYHLMDLDQLPGRTLKDVLHACRTAGFRGLNVTYPCKETVLPLLDEVSAEARQIGAVNTVVIAREGRTVGYNTDRIGFRRAFEDELGAEAVRGKAAVLVGAGGAGRAVAFALLDLGARTLLVHDARPEAAEALAEALRRFAGPERAATVLDVEAALARSAGIVNATPVGMLGIPGNPLPTNAVTADHWVADVIYTPLETECLKQSRARSAKVMGGAGMCVHQAAETFRLFTGRAPDTPRLRAIFDAAAAEREKFLSG